MKTLNTSNANSASKAVKDIEFWGNGDNFKLISKASSKNEMWMKSTKAMEIVGLGCVVQVTTQQGFLNGNVHVDTHAVEWSVAEAVCFVPGCFIKERLDDNNNVISRVLVHNK